MEWYLGKNCIVLDDICILPYDHSIPPVNIVRSILLIACCLMVCVLSFLTILPLFNNACLCLQFGCLHHAYCGLSIVHLNYVFHHCNILSSMSCVYIVGLYVSFFLACIRSFLSRVYIYILLSCLAAF